MSKSFVYSSLFFVLVAFTAAAQPGRGPSKVAASEITEGVLAPQTEMTGTIYFSEVADVASEVRGKVRTVLIEEGQVVNQGDVLVQLDQTLLKKDLKAHRAVLKRNNIQLIESQVRLDRIKGLIEEGISTIEQFDSTRYEVQALDYEVESTMANVERLEELLEKHIIRAPFDGVVLERSTDLGEWASEGATIAVLARSGEFDIKVNVPELMVRWITPNSEVELSQGERSKIGKVVTIIPKGDVATRTFPVKIRVSGVTDWLEGLSAQVMLPSGAKQSCLMIPRDAIVRNGTKMSVFVIQDNTAQEVSIRVLGYQGELAGIVADRLQLGQQVVTKGNERLRSGTEVMVVDVQDREIRPIDSDD